MTLYNVLYNCNKITITVNDLMENECKMISICSIVNSHL